MKYPFLVFTFLIIAFISACNPERQEIYYGEEECTHCNMIISEPQFASQLVTTRGRHFNFDAIECMAAYLESESVKQEDIHSLWVQSLNNETWIHAEEAYYLRSSNLRSPMSLNLSAYQDIEAAEEYKRNYTGEVFTWREIQALVQREWLNHH